eukprot:CAMPEP_0197491796 /NCGR_PEP_ID=MMETSP1311-20131121/5948_1 /TAXON_ID=464262 /ORGANISM="Genus nov. species nov., Strain RCC856" /LENGTH=80 /DNA_ID=CAMNT_0043036503 /DNA_START=351 /DNA_END=589 /DNA_ORIENTATION=+
MERLWGGGEKGTLTGTQDDEDEESQHEWADSERILLALSAVHSLPVDVVRVFGALGLRVALGKNHGDLPREWAAADKRTF